MAKVCIYVMCNRTKKEIVCVRDLWLIKLNIFGKSRSCFACHKTELNQKTNKVYVADFANCRKGILMLCILL